MNVDEELSALLTGLREQVNLPTQTDEEFLSIATTLDSCVDAYLLMSHENGMFLVCFVFYSLWLCRSFCLPDTLSSFRFLYAFFRQHPKPLLFIRLPHQTHDRSLSSPLTRPPIPFSCCQQSMNAGVYFSLLSPTLQEPSIVLAPVVSLATVWAASSLFFHFVLPLFFPLAHLPNISDCFFPFLQHTPTLSFFCFRLFS